MKKTLTTALSVAAVGATLSGCSFTYIEDCENDLSKHVTATKVWQTVLPLGTPETRYEFVTREHDKLTGVFSTERHITYSEVPHTRKDEMAVAKRFCDTGEISLNV